MANRNYVGGTADWNGTAGSKWSLTEGGAGGQAVPTVADDVKFNAGSGAVTATVVGARVALNLDFTGFTGTFAGAAGVTVSASLTLGAGMTWTNTAQITMNATSTGHLVTFNGSAIGGLLGFNGVGGGWTFQDAASIVSSLSLTNGTLDLNDKNVSCATFGSSNSNTRVLSLGNGTISVTGTGTQAWNIGTTTGLTFDAEGSTIKFTNSSTSSKTFAGGGLTYNNFWNATGNTGQVVITGSNTFDDFKIDAGRDQRFTAGTAQTVTTFTVPNDAGNGITLQSVTAGSAWDLVCSSGTITVKGCTIIDSHASGGATFNALASDGNIDGGGNTGWDFGVVTHATDGALTGPGSTVAGTAAHIAIHSTSGVLIAPGSTVAGDAARTRAHATDGALATSGAALAGTSVHNIPHATEGGPTGQGAVVEGSAARTRDHATTGEIAGSGVTLAGTARHNIPHATTGDLAGLQAFLSGLAAHHSLHTTTGALVGPGSAIFGVSVHNIPHATSGVLTAQGARIVGSAEDEGPEISDFNVIISAGQFAVELRAGSMNTQASAGQMTVNLSQ